MYVSWEMSVQRSQCLHLRNHELSLLLMTTLMCSSRSLICSLSSLLQPSRFKAITRSPVNFPLAIFSPRLQIVSISYFRAYQHLPYPSTTALSRPTILYHPLLSPPLPETATMSDRSHFFDLPHPLFNNPILPLETLPQPPNPTAPPPEPYLGSSALPQHTRPIRVRHFINIPHLGSSRTTANVKEIPSTTSPQHGV